MIIIGSGITGCSISRHLLLNDKSDLRITVLEARNTCSGATGRNGGNIKAVPEHTMPLMGKDGAREIVHFTLANVEELIRLSEEELTPELRREGEVRRVETLNVFTTEAGFEEFAKAVGEFDEAFPEFRGRGRLVKGRELREVSLLVPLFSAVALLVNVGL